MADLISSTLAAVTTLALVGQEPAPLRAAPSDSATIQAQLTPGDALEVRGERLGYLQVYDHRRERGGYVRAHQVHQTRADPADAPALLAVLRFVKDTPGQEALGVGLAAAYLKAVPAQGLTAEPFDALGTMAERLARRASGRPGAAGGLAASGTPDARLAAQLDGVAAYGVRLLSQEQDGVMRLCYDGEAFRRVLAMPQATAPQRARAVLGLTRHDCISAALPASERVALDRWRADLLMRLGDGEMATLPAGWRQRVQMRRAGVMASLAFAQARRGENPQAAGQGALQALAAVNPAELSDEDRADYNEAAILVGASRWAAESPVAPGLASGPAGRSTQTQRPSLLTQPGQPGETCVLLIDAQHGADAPLLKQCSWGVVWPASARMNAAGTALTLAVQPLATWRELWLLKRNAEGRWEREVLPPSTGQPLGSDLGYLEFAGWVPEGEPRVLLARESRSDGRYSRRFEVMRLADGSLEKQASQPQWLASFQRWQDPGWKRQSVSLR